MVWASYNITHLPYINFLKLGIVLHYYVVNIIKLFLLICIGLMVLDCRFAKAEAEAVFC